MGLLSASSGFTRFRIVDEVPDTLWTEIPERLKRFAFKEIENTADERAWGWVCLDDMLDSFWRTAPPEKGGYFAFTLRLDTRRVAPAVFKKHFTIAVRKEEQVAKEQGRKYLGRERKKEIKEQVMLKLMARSFPIPAVFDAVWNIQEGRIYLCCTGSKVIELFMNHFTDTFDLHIEPLTPFALGLALLGEAAQPKLDELEAAVFAG